MENDKFNDIQAIIERDFQITQITHGSEKKTFLVQYQGEFIDKDTAKVYLDIEKELSRFGLIPLFRKEGLKKIIYVVNQPPNPNPLNPKINLIFFLLTLVSVLFTGGLYAYEGQLPANTWNMIWELIKNGWPFAVSLLTILATHEFGHYFAGKRHSVRVTLPYFIPFPFSVFGTMGAFINMRSIPRNKRELFDLAITGPLAGLVVSIIVLVIGLNLSELGQLPTAPSADFTVQMEGNSIFYLLLKYLTFGKLLPNPQGIEGVPLVIFWFQYFFTGQPFPWGAIDVLLHPVAWAGWAGILVTSLNLIPAGQLDGGHIFFTLFGKKTSRSTFPFIISGLVLLGFFWNTWWLWAALVFFLGRRYAEPLDQVTELDPKRKWLGVLGILIFFLTFIPVPISLY